MSYLFKKGDIVRYKKDQISYMPENLHGEPDATKEFVVEDNGYNPKLDYVPERALIKFKGDKEGAGCLAYRLELVKEAPKKKKPKPEGNFAWGVFFEDGELLKLTKTRQEARDYKIDRAYMYERVLVKKIKYEIV